MRNGQGEVVEIEKPLKRKRITWAQAGNLTTGDGGASSVQMQSGEFEVEARYYTVQISSPGPNNGGSFQALATVTFFINGVPTVRQVSVGQAVQVSGCADAISVRVTDQTPAAWANNGQVYGVTVVCAPGQRANSNVYPILADTNGNFAAGTGVYSITGAGSKSVSIPDSNTGVNGFYLTFDVTNPPAGTFGLAIIQQLSSAGTIIWEGGVAGNTIPWVPLMPGATKLSIQNATGGGSQMNFTVAWSIDG